MSDEGAVCHRAQYIQEAYDHFNENNTAHLSAKRTVVPCVALQVLSAELQLFLQLLLQNIHLFLSTKNLRQREKQASCDCGFSVLTG